MPLTSNISFDIPGVYVTEETYGAVPASLASFGTVYMMGYSNKAGAPVDTITFIQSVDDFTNIFGASLSAASVKLFFDQRSGSGLYFVNVSAKASRTLTVPTVTVGASYTLTINSTTVSVVAVTGDDANAIIAKLAKEVNLRFPSVAYVYGNVLSYIPSATVTSSANVTLGVAAAAAAYPTAYDVIQSMSVAFDPDMRQGYILAPEFFQSFTAQADRTNLAMAMEALASDPDYNWISLVDAGASVATGDVVGMVNRAIAERNLLSSPKGHSAYFFPYWLNTTNTAVPMSASVAGVAIRAYRAKGFTQPPAGVSFPVYGVFDTSFQISNKVQALLNPIGVNCGRRLPAGRGTVIYGSRTLSVNPYYKFVTTRVIMNVLAGTLSNAFDEFVFSAVDGLGVLFSRIKLTCVGICETLRNSGALFGTTPEQAYLVTCDETNNPKLDLESGKVVVDVVVKPAPILEALQVRLTRASLATNLQETVASGNSNPTVQTAKDPQPN